MMKKRRYAWIIPYGGVIVGLLLALRYDLRIDQFLYDPDNVFGLFFERFLLIPIALLVPICFYALYRIHQDRRFLICYGIAIMYVVMDSAHYWIRLSQSIWYLIPLSLLVMVFAHLLLRRISIQLWKHHERFLIFLLAVFLSSLLITFVWKRCWGRIRFREMIPDFDQFSAWIIPQGMNGHRSFPSGHTTTITVILCFLYYYKEKEPLREVSFMIKLLLWALVIAMMISRMIMGAHFLSDVMMGFAITYTMIQVWRRRFFKEDMIWNRE